MTRSHHPLPGDMYRLTSGRIVMVESVQGDMVLCHYTSDGKALHLTARYLVKQWRLA